MPRNWHFPRVVTRGKRQSVYIPWCLAAASGRRREGGVEGGVGLVEGQPADERERLGGTDEAVHAGVLPLDADRAVVADGVEHPEGRLPGDVAVAGRDEVPAAARVGPGEVRAEAAVAAVADLELRVLAVDVVDPVLEVPEERDWVEVLPHEV